MKIFSKTHSSEEAIALEVESSDTINVVRTKINDQLRLMIGVELLVDGTKTVADYRIEEGSTLCLVPRYIRHRRRSGGIQIFVKNLVGKVLKYEVDVSDTVNELKEMVANHVGFPVHQQRLISNSKLLEDGKTLFECNVVQGSTIHCVPRLRGS